MGMLDFFRRRERDSELELPVLPLHSVLFPLGVLPLKVVEPRNMDMVLDCLKNQRPFGACLIAEARQPQPGVHDVGVLASIASWDRLPMGALNIVARGEHRFRIMEHRTDPSGLPRARVTPLADEESLPVPETLKSLLPLLRAITIDAGKSHIAEPYRFDDASWVGYRFAEVLPIPLIARQKLLELDDPVSRLEIIHKFLAQRGLV